MRRSVVLVYALCVSAAAFAVVQIYRGERFEAVLKLRLASSSLDRPVATVEGAAARLMSEATPSEGSENPAPGEPSRSAEDRPDEFRNKAAPAPSADGPKLTVARISTSGSESVFAGSAAPGSAVTVLDNGVPVASATANANGDWSLVTDHRFTGSDPKISLRTGALAPPADENAESSGSPPLPAISENIASSAASPSAQVLKKFESIVETARKDAQAGGSAESAVAAAGPTPAVAPAVTPPTTNVRADAPSSESLRDSDHLSSATIPVPMTFVFDEATLTPEGEKTARLLLEYLLLKKFTSITLSGHADERGTAEYNMELSRRRLDTVSAVLRDGGYRGKMNLVPKGATEPFTGVDRSKFSRDDLMQLDRRVELRNAS